jgi:glutamate dehydrogenase
MSYWLLENHRGDLEIERAVRRYAGPVAELARELEETLSATARARMSAERTRLTEQRVPNELATRIVALEIMQCALDLADVARQARVRIGYAARAYFELGERIGLAWIKEQIEGLPAEGHWQAVARGTLRDNLFSLQRKLTGAALKCRGRSPDARVDRWSGAHAAEVDALKRIVVDLRTGAAPDFATLSVALQAVRRLTPE